MKALRSSPVLPLASALQVFILLCWAVPCATGLALRHSFMKALRSSPFLPVASWLQVAILLCWAVLAGGATVGAAGDTAGAGAAFAGAADAAFAGAAGALWARAPADRPIVRAKAMAIRDSGWFMVAPISEMDVISGRKSTP
ncbi:MAG: hypothetical protein JWP77_1969 [Polaromonas sp.]|nr:hypothetical protein [Polaromonas sp.]